MLAFIKCLRLHEVFTTLVFLYQHFVVLKNQLCAGVDRTDIICSVFSAVLRQLRLF